jgi:IclR helix-turn-helix domain
MRFDRLSSFSFFQSVFTKRIRVNVLAPYHLSLCAVNASARREALDLIAADVLIESRDFVEVSSILWNNRKTAWAQRRWRKRWICCFLFSRTLPSNLFQISRRLRFPPSTTRRLLKAMMSRRLVQQDPITKLYRLGPGVFYLASVAKEGLDVRRIAFPIMERLRDVTGENTTLH